jgi:hypothetical protein
MTVALQPQYLPAFKREPIHLRALLPEQWVEHQLGVAMGCLLFAARSTANLSRDADEDLMAETLHRFNEPGAVSAGFQANYHITCELSVESTNVILVVMKFSVLDEAISHVAIAYGLLTRVKVHATIRLS